MEKYKIPVPVVLFGPFPSLEDMSIQDAENIFVTLRNNAQNYERKDEYEQCRAILNFAGSCDASLIEVNRKSRAIVRFTFEFSNLEQARHFMADFHTCIK